MAQAHAFIKQVLTNSAQANNAGVHWHQIISALTEVSAHQCAESEEILRAILTQEAEVQLSPQSSPTHAMAPKDLMRSIAIQTLAKWDKAKHKDVISQVAQSTRSHLLAAIARAHL